MFMYIIQNLSTYQTSNEKIEIKFTWKKYVFLLLPSKYSTLYIRKRDWKTIAGKQINFFMLTSTNIYNNNMYIHYILLLM